MNATLQLDRRVERAGQALAYLLLNIPIAILGALGVLVLVIGAAFSIIAIGLPILLGAAAVCRRLVRLDRRAANGLLGTQVPPLPAGVRGSGDPWHRSLEVLSDRSLWRVMAVLAMKVPLIAGLLVVGLAPVLFLAELINLSVQAIGGLGGIDYLGPWSFGAGLGLLLLALTLPVAILAHCTPSWRPSLRCSSPRAWWARDPCARCSPRASATAPSRSPTGSRTGGPSSTRSGGPSTCPSPARGAPGPPSSATAAGSPRSCTTRPSTRRPSSSTRRPRHLRWRSTTSA